MMDLPTYKRNAAEAIKRLRLLYERQAPDQIFAAFDLPSPTLSDFKQRHADGVCEYPDPLQRIRFWDQLLAERVALEDDSLPSAYLSELDQGLYSGVLGGDVRFNCNPDTGWISSMAIPLLAIWADFGHLRLDPDHAWFKRYALQLAIFIEGAHGKFGISNIIMINGLNFVFELVGATETYLGLIDCPDLIRRAMTLGFQINAEIQRRFFAAGPLVAGGTCSFGVQWMPGRIVAESVDPFHMTSVDCFEEWGRAISEQIMAEFDGGTTHLHGNGRHLTEAVCSLRGLRAVCLGDDKGFAPAIDELKDLRRRAGDMPLVVPVSFVDFKRRLDRQELSGGALYLVHGADTVSEINRTMESVRAYRV
jgi:hypothetical protein